MENKVIGIEGYVGAGKTSICRKLINLIPNSIIEPCRYKICNGKVKY